MLGRCTAVCLALWCACIYVDDTPDFWLTTHLTFALNQSFLHTFNSGGSTSVLHSMRENVGQERVRGINMHLCVVVKKQT